MSDRDDRPIEVRSPLETPTRATEVGFVAGATGQSILQSIVTLHWRDALRATRDRRRPASETRVPDPRFRQAGELPEGVHRAGD